MNGINYLFFVYMYMLVVIICTRSEQIRISLGLFTNVGYRTLDNLWASLSTAFKGIAWLAAKI